MKILDFSSSLIDEQMAWYKEFHLNPELSMKEYRTTKRIKEMQNLYDRSNDKTISSAISWVYAMDQKTIRFALDSRSYVLNIIEEDPKISLNFIGLESVYSVVGRSRIKVRETAELTLKLALVEVKVEEVWDINFYGSKIDQDPKFIKTYNLNLVEKPDHEVYEAILKI